MQPYIRNHYDHNLKLCLTGNYSVGKTSLLFRFVDDKFDQVCLTTIPFDFKFRTIQLNNKYIRLTLWDSSGQERFRSLIKAYFKGIHGALFIFDLTDKESLSILSKCYDKYLQSNSSNTKLMLIGNKCDLESERKVSYEEACEFAKSLNMQYIETSAKTKENVEEVIVNLAKRIIEDIDERQSQSGEKMGDILDNKYIKKCTCW